MDKSLLLLLFLLCSYDQSFFIQICRGLGGLRSRLVQFVLGCLFFGWVYTALESATGSVDLRSVCFKIYIEYSTGNMEQSYLRYYADTNGNGHGWTAECNWWHSLSHRAAGGALSSSHTICTKCIWRIFNGCVGAKMRLQAVVVVVFYVFLFLIFCFFSCYSIFLICLFGGFVCAMSCCA